MNTDKENTQENRASRANPGALARPLSNPKRSPRNNAVTNHAVHPLPTTLAEEVPKTEVILPESLPVTSAVANKDQTIEVTGVAGKDNLKVIPLTDAPGIITTLLRTQEFQDYATMLVNAAMVATNSSFVIAISNDVCSYQ